MEYQIYSDHEALRTSSAPLAVRADSAGEKTIAMALR